MPPRVRRGRSLAQTGICKAERVGQVARESVPQVDGGLRW